MSKVNRKEIIKKAVTGEGNAIPILNQAATFFTAQVGSASESVVFQDYVREDLRKQGRDLASLTRDEYNKYLKEVVQSMAKLYS